MTEAVPEVSVLIPAFNEEQHLGTTIRGALAILGAQGLPFEIVVVDDGSTDGSAAVASDVVRTDSRVRLLRHERNRGLGASHFTGVEASRGEYVTWAARRRCEPSGITGADARRQARRGYRHYVPRVRRPEATTPQPALRVVRAAHESRLRMPHTLLQLHHDRAAGGAHDGPAKGEPGVWRVRGDPGSPVTGRTQLYGDANIHSAPATGGQQGPRWRNVVSVCHQTVWLWWSVRRPPVTSSAEAGATSPHVVGDRDRTTVARGRQR